MSGRSFLGENHVTKKKKKKKKNAHAWPLSFKKIILFISIKIVFHARHTDLPISGSDCAILHTVLSLKINYEYVDLKL